MTNSYDVVIIGAGPAGSTAALFLAQNNFRVLVIEKNQFPRYKVCGGGLLGRAINLLPDTLNIPIEKSIFQVDLTLPHIDKNFSVKRPKPMIQMTMRSELDNALLNHALENGAKVAFSAQVKSISYHNDYVNISTGTSVYKAKFIIAADGVNSIVCKSLGLGKNKKLSPAIEWEIETNDETFEKLSNIARFDYAAAPMGYGWVFPKKNHLSVGLLSNNIKNNSLNTLAKQYVEKTIGTKNIISIQKHGFVIPVKPYPNLNTHPRALLAGDAAGLVDPLTAEGLSHAILSGKLAAKALIKENLDSANVLTRYMKYLDQQILPELKCANFLSSIFYRKTWLHQSLMSRYGQSLCEQMTQIISGEQTYKSLLLNPKKYLKLLTRFRKQA